MAKKGPPALIISFIILLISLFRPSSVNASVLFEDNFDDGDANGWIVARNMQWNNQSQPCYNNTSPAKWEVKNGKYGIIINGRGCVTESVPDDSQWDSSWKNYIIDVDMDFVRGTDKNLAWRYSSPSRWYDVHFISPKSLQFQRLPTGSGIRSAAYPIPNGKTYHITVEVREESSKLFIDGNLVLDYSFNPADDRFPFGKIALQASVGSDRVSEVWFDNVVVRSIDEAKSPVVVLPGMGGSWNTTAFITGASNGTWKKTPFVKVYDNLKNTFVNNAGYTEGEDYFEFYYDWRKNLDGLADDFKNYLENIVLQGKPAETKVNLIGHSMGGLVARAYSQKYGTEKIKEIVTVGSPHQGALPAWQAWLGGEVGDRWSWQWITLQMLLQIHKVNYSSPVDAVRNIAPGLEDLMPIFDFLKNDNDASIKTIAELTEQNSYLADMANSLNDNLKNLMDTIVGKEDDSSRDTIEWYRISERNLADRLLGKWIDGKPVSYEYTDAGDLTVLAKSASISGVLSAPIVNKTHVGLIETQAGIQAILDALEITGVAPANDSPSLPRNPALIFFLRSPAEIRVTAPDGSQAGYGVDNPMANTIYSPADKLLIIYEAQDGNYQVEVLGTGSGIYHLDLGQLTKGGEKWNTIQDAISAGENDIYQIMFTANNPQDSPIVDSSGKTQLALAKQQLEALQDYINSQSFSLAYRRQLVHYINRIIRLVDKGLSLAEAGNYSRAQRYAKAAMAGCYSLRIRLNQLARGNRINNNIQAYISNEANDIGQLLLNGYVAVFKQSGQGISRTRASRKVNSSERIKDRVAGRLESIKGVNAQLGKALLLSQQNLEKAQSALDDGDFSRANANALLSRLLSLESLRLSR